MSDQTTIQNKTIRYELVNYLRSKDIVPIATRGVATKTISGTFTAISTFTCPDTNVKNIRSITVASVPLKYGRDYALATGGVINFVAAQTGAYSIQYDYGNQDSIYPDLPRDFNSISSFPRVGIQWLGASTTPGGFGNVDVSDIDLSIVIWATTTDEVERIISAIRTYIRQDKSNFWYLGSWVQVSAVGPFIMEDVRIGKDKIVHQNIDIIGRIRYEK